MWTLALVPLGLVLGHLRFEVFKIVHRILESHGGALWQIFTMYACLCIIVYAIKHYHNMDLFEYLDFVMEL